MNGRSNVPEKRSTAALAAGMAVAVYTAAVIFVVGGIAPAAHAAGDEHDRDRDGGRGDGNRGARDDHHDGRGRDHDWREREARSRYEQQHYWRYQRPVYVPPPVTYYPPPASPGINLVLPLEFRIR